MTSTASATVSPVSQVNELAARKGKSVSLARGTALPAGTTISRPGKRRDSSARCSAAEPATFARAAGCGMAGAGSQSLAMAACRCSDIGRSCDDVSLASARRGQRLVALLVSVMPPESRSRRRPAAVRVRRALAVPRCSDAGHVAVALTAGSRELVIVASAGEQKVSDRSSESTSTRG